MQFSIFNFSYIFSILSVTKELKIYNRENNDPR